MPASTTASGGATVASLGHPSRVKVVVKYIVEMLARAVGDAETSMVINGFVHQHDPTMKAVQDCLFDLLKNADGYQIPAGLTGNSKEELESAFCGLYVAAYGFVTSTSDLNEDSLERFLNTIQHDMRLLAGALSDNLWNFDFTALKEVRVPSEEKDATTGAVKNKKQVEDARNLLAYQKSPNHPMKFMKDAQGLLKHLRSITPKKDETNYTNEADKDQVKDKTRGLVKPQGLAGVDLFPPLNEKVLKDSIFSPLLFLLKKCSQMTGFDLKNACPDFRKLNKWTVAYASSPWLTLGGMTYMLLLHEVTEVARVPNFEEVFGSLAANTRKLFNQEGAGLMQPVDKDYDAYDVFRIGSEALPHVMACLWRHCDTFIQMAMVGNLPSSDQEVILSHYSNLVTIKFLFDHQGVLNYGHSLDDEQKTKDDDPTKRAHSAIPLDVRHWLRGAYAAVNVTGRRKRGRGKAGVAGEEAEEEDEDK